MVAASLGGKGGLSAKNITTSMSKPKDITNSVRREKVKEGQPRSHTYIYYLLHTSVKILDLYGHMSRNVAIPFFADTRPIPMLMIKYRRYRYQYLCGIGMI